ncbi:FGGY-family carbohydrate kinase [uncultured Draconibacterium sp.]|uniref:FGGY-family carbohydrate kinase n=1 Tax=uncultured Draconibacterium sp. TaxID=1573823 RepID=UPI0029C71A12|nr:FGGY-family carbohydrate kinase [uncultured Draconibacterium sp.]
MSYIGIDIGTSGCKAVVFDNDGIELASSYREYTVLRPFENWAELNSEDVLSKCFEVIKEVNSKVSVPVVAMGISSQGEAFTPVGENGKIIGNAMVSSDSRAVDLIPEFSNTFGEEKLYSITGHTSHPLFTLFKLIWVKQNQPKIWEDARYFLCFEDLLHLKLGIQPHISWPMAGRTMLFDVIKHEWSDDILSVIGLDKSRLANPVPSGQIVGKIEESKARELGFQNEVAVVSGGHDQTVAALGAGIVNPGSCMYATGTVECFCPILSKPTFSEQLRKNNLCCYDYTVDGSYTTVAYSLTGGNILKWVRNELGYEEKQKAETLDGNAYTFLLEKMPDDPTKLLVLPYFSATGTPYFDTKAKGAIIGLQHSTTKGEITKALLEGVALEMKLNLQLMEESGMCIDSFVATGGGTKNNAWTQLKADVLNKKVIVRNVNEAGCYGAALLAQSAVSDVPVKGLIRSFSQSDKVFQPDPVKAKEYEKKFESYKNLYPALKQFWSVNK